MKLLFLFFIFFQVSHAESLRVFVASSAKDAFIEIRQSFIKTHKDSAIELVFGASGKAYQQFLQGLHYDIFVSADAQYPKQIFAQHKAASEPSVYALGVVALYSPDPTLLKSGLLALKEHAHSIRHFSIANAKVAPYGVAAEEILRNAQLYETFKDKLVRGDNVSQSVSFVDSGAAQVGLVAYSLLFKGDRQRQAIIVDPSLYSPLEHTLVITQQAKDNPLAQAFARFILSEEGRAILQKYGFGVP